MSDNTRTVAHPPGPLSTPPRTRRPQPPAGPACRSGPGPAADSARCGRPVRPDLLKRQGETVEHYAAARCWPGGQPRADELATSHRPRPPCCGRWRVCSAATWMARSNWACTCCTSPAASWSGPRRTQARRAAHRSLLLPCWLSRGVGNQPWTVQAIGQPCVNTTVTKRACKPTSTCACRPRSARWDEKTLAAYLWPRCKALVAGLPNWARANRSFANRAAGRSAGVGGRPA